MIIPVTLNGEKTVLNVNPADSLLSVLRQRKLFSVKKGCQKGRCGFCTVLLNDKPVPSCRVPAGIVSDCTIVTLEYFSKTPEYNDIMKGFNSAGITMCGYCNSAKIFCVYDLMQNTYRPDKEQLYEIADSLTCSCTERDTFISGILYAIANKHAREGKKINVTR